MNVTNAGMAAGAAAGIGAGIATLISAESAQQVTRRVAYEAEGTATLDYGEWSRRDGAYNARVTGRSADGRTLEVVARSTWDRYDDRTLRGTVTGWDPAVPVETMRLERAGDGFAVKNVDVTRPQAERDADRRRAVIIAGSAAGVGALSLGSGLLLGRFANAPSAAGALTTFGLAAFAAPLTLGGFAALMGGLSNSASIVKDAIPSPLPE